MASWPTASEGKGAGEAAARRRACDDRLVAMVRGGDTTAFEAIYDRHCEELLSFCQYMLGCRQDAEDALQSTFASAYRALRADRRSVVLRPWLFTIARNVCVSTLRQRRPESDAELPASAAREDPCVQAERREDVRDLLAGLRDLPERQRVAIVLAELHGFTHSEIAGVLDVRPDQVKSYVFQARSALISDRQARCADCRSIREELAAARGSALLRTHLRRHLRACEECRGYAEELARQRRRLGALLPLGPALLLRRLRGLFGGASAKGAYASGGALGPSASWGVMEVAGGGNAIVAKLLTGMALVGAGTGVGTAVLGRSTSSVGTAPHVRTSGADKPSAAADGGRLSASTSARASTVTSLTPPGASAAPARADTPHTATSAPNARSARDLSSSGSGAPTGRGRSSPPHVVGVSYPEDPANRGRGAGSGAGPHKPGQPRKAGAQAHGPAKPGGPPSKSRGRGGAQDHGEAPSDAGATDSPGASSPHAPGTSGARASSSGAAHQTPGSSGPPARVVSEDGATHTGSANLGSARSQGSPSGPPHATAQPGGPPPSTGKGPSGPPGDAGQGRSEPSPGQRYSLVAPRDVEAAAS